MKSTSKIAVRSFAFCGSLLYLNALFAQGPLLPPGPPAPTMKTLDQVQPQIPIDSVHTPGNSRTEFIINQPGSYYLTAALTVTKDVAISIAASGVSVDLKGFRISRASGSGGWGILIGLDGTADRCFIHDGSITGFSIGVDGGNALAGTYTHLNVAGCSSHGLRAGEGSLVDSCHAQGNSGYGILAAPSVSLEGSRFTNCLANENGASGIASGPFATVTGCTANNNEVMGIWVGAGSAVTDCTAVANHANGFEIGAGSTVSKCTAQLNSSTQPASYGIHAGVGCTIVGCASLQNHSSNGTASTSTGVGISVDNGSVIKDCAVSGNDGTGIQVADNCIVSTSSSRGNGNRIGYGITAGSGAAIDHCTVAANRAGGILTLGGSEVTQSAVYSNQGCGIHVSDGSTVSNCTVRLNTTEDGILLTGGCRIVENLCDQNGGGGTGAGIHAFATSSRIEGNTVTFNTTAGIKLDQGGNTVFRNSARGNPTAYAIVPGNDVGPIGTAASSTSPFTNIQF